MVRTCAVMLCLLVGASPIHAEELALRARAALALVAITDSPFPVKEPTSTPSERAIAKGVPLLTFVGQPPRRPPGCVCEITSTDVHKDVNGQGVIVDRPQGGKLVRDCIIVGTPSPEAICQIAHPKAPTPQPIPTLAPRPIPLLVSPPLSSCPNGQCPLR